MATPARCIYHLVPSNLAGSILYPLNRLKETFPEVAVTHVKKYEGREGLLNRRIPLREAGHLFRPPEVVRDRRGAALCVRDRHLGIPAARARPRRLHH